jgi:hypothetical protein
MLGPALQLVMAHHAELDTREALELLPGHATLSQLWAAVGTLLRDANERRRATQVLCNLSKARSVQVHSELLDRRAGRLLVSEDTACSVCGKRIGLAAFATQPGAGAMSVAHLSCGGGAASNAPPEPGSRKPLSRRARRPGRTGRVE